MRRTLLVMFLVTGSLLAVSAVYRRMTPEVSAGRIPAVSNEVLERVPARLNDAFSQKTEALRASLAQNPEDLSAAVRLARLELQEGRAHGDPRRLGYAQAALAPWWRQATPPDEVLLLRATLEQSLHAFPEALADLELLLQRDPSNAQAWITRAVVLAVRGEYAQSEESCRPLGALAGILVETVCMTNAQSQHGKAREAFERLELTLRQQSEELPVEVSTWALSTLADAAARSGNERGVESNLQRALALDPKDPFLLAAYADHLLDAHRPEEVLKLLRDEKQNDGLLLRRVLAEKALGASNDDADELRARYAASHLRGDSLHRREEARFVLSVEKEPARALALARANWEVQKEFWDARILLESALAARAPQAAKPVLDALELNHAEDPTLLELARRVRELES